MLIEECYGSSKFKPLTPMTSAFRQRLGCCGTQVTDSHDFDVDHGQFRVDSCHDDFSKGGHACLTMLEDVHHDVPKVISMVSPFDETSICPIAGLHSHVYGPTGMVHLKEIRSTVCSCQPYLLGDF